MRSPMTGRVYIVTRYREHADGQFIATTKYEVPEEEIAACGMTVQPLDEWRPLGEPT